MSQFNFSNQGPATGQSSASSSSSVSSDKLRKAIERNRMRQAKREGRATTAKPAAKATPASNPRQQEFFFNSQSTPRSTMPSGSSQRISVATPASETTFVRPVKARTTTKKSSIKYPVKKTSTTKRKRVKATKARNAWLMKGAWILLGLIFIRLVFAERGIIDYFSMKDLIGHKLDLIEQTKVENKAILKEMEMIKNNSRYQKQIVREKLGFITKDEYLVIFSGESARESN